MEGEAKDNLTLGLSRIFTLSTHFDGANFSENISKPLS